MLRFRRLTSPPPVEEASASLLSELQYEIELFEINATNAGLPWIDKRMYREELLKGATLSRLPRISKLNRILERQASLAEEIIDRCKRREAAVNELLMMCAFDHSHMQCSHSAHRDACEGLKYVDDETDAIIRLIREWRAALAHPLPMMIEGENYLIRMHNQFAAGKSLAHLGAHLRNTCRHLQYYYSSSYDPAMIDSNKVLQRDELFTLRAEPDAQVKLCEYALKLARMGMYEPVLKFRHRVAPASSLPPMVMLDNRKWKAQLILSYANGLVALSRSRPVQDQGVVSAMMQFAGVATTVLHKRYFLLWLGYRKRRIERRRAVRGMALMADMMLMQRYLQTWQRRWSRVVRLKGQCDALLLTSHNALRRRYMQKLFLKAATKRAERLVKRGMYLRYFRALQYRATVNILLGTCKSRTPAARGEIATYADAAKVAPWAAAMQLIGNSTLIYLQTAVLHAANTQQSERRDA